MSKLRLLLLAAIFSLIAPLRVAGGFAFVPATRQWSRSVKQDATGMVPLCADRRSPKMTAHSESRPGMSWKRMRRVGIAGASGVPDKPLYPTNFHRCFYFILMRLFAVAGRFVMKTLNTTVLHDSNGQLMRLVTHRSRDIGLLTVSNHCSMADDPGIWCGTLPYRAFTPPVLRTILMVEEFYYALGSFTAAVFRGLKCLPLRRGDLRGLQSPQLFAVHSRLNGKMRYYNNQKRREWCHIFVEGRVLQPWRFDPFGLPRLGKLRRGAAKLIATSPPSKLIVLPIFHDGMHKILPETPPPGTTGMIPENRSGKTKCWIPRVGQRVDVYVGDPIDFSDLVPPEGLSFNGNIDTQLLQSVTGRLRHALLILEKRAANDRKARGEDDKK